MVFIDTNIIVYANDTRDPVKQERAVELMREAFLSGHAVISVQVLQEYANTALTKLGQDRAVIIHQIALLSQLMMVEPDAKLVSRAVELTALYPVSFWDASIVAAAERAGCKELWSEDMNPDQSYGTVQVKNPFLKKKGPPDG